VPCLVAYIIYSSGYHSGRGLHVSKSKVEHIIEEVVLCTNEGEDWKSYIVPDMKDDALLLKSVLEDFVGILCQQSRSSFAMLHRTLQEFLVAKLLSLDGSDYKNRRLAALRDVVVCGGEAAGGLQPFCWSDSTLICSDWWDEVYRFAGLIRGPRWIAQQMLGAPNNSTTVDKWLALIREEGFDRKDLMQRRLWHVMRACCDGKDTDKIAERLIPVLLSTVGKKSRYFTGVYPARHFRVQQWQNFPQGAYNKYVQALLECAGRGETGAGEALLAVGKTAAEMAGVVETLVVLLKDGNDGVKGSAVVALRSVGKTAAEKDWVVESLVELLNHDNPSVRARAADVLGSMGETAAKKVGVVESLVELLNDSDYLVSHSAAQALSRVSKTAAEKAGTVEELMNMLKDSDYAVRVCAAENLNRLGEAAARKAGVRESLVELLKDDDPYMRKIAAWILGNMGRSVAEKTGVLESLMDLLKDDDRDVRASAAAALGSIGQATAEKAGVVESLAELLKDDN